jgi:hypothetical protein
MLRAPAHDPILIATYWLLFICIGLVFWSSDARLDRIASLVVFGGGTLGAILDVLENQAILVGAEPWAEAKWLSISVTAIGVAVPPVARSLTGHDYHLLGTVGGIFLAAGGLLGVFLRETPDSISVALLLGGAGLLFVALLFVWEPEYISAKTLLMQRIFIDLDLERASDHPHNKGWMEIFHLWRKLDAVELAWRATKQNYGRRFQWFVEHL